MTWDDIGGLDDVKKRVRRLVEWPLERSDAFKRLGLTPPTGPWSFQSVLSLLPHLLA